MVSPGNHEIEHIFVNKTNAAGKIFFYELFNFKENHDSIYFICLSVIIALKNESDVM